MKKSANKDLISVIIPVYKVEKYIKKCVESVLNQTYENYEIILVDDGSPDNCPNICDEYAKLNKKIKTYHKQNGGLSDARNYGIERSVGEYITFIDSDDFVQNTYLEVLYTNIKKNDCEVSACSHFVLYNNSKINLNKIVEKKYDKNTAMKDLLYGYIDTSSWAKLYKREIFNDIKFPVGKIFEDTATTYKIFDKCKNIYVTTEQLYNYVIRENSITTSKFNKKKFDLINVSIEMHDFIKKNYPQYIDASISKLLRSYISTYNLLITYKNDFNKEKKEIQKFIKDNRKTTIFDSNAMKKERIALITTLFGFYTYNIVYKIYKKLSRR